MTGKERAKLRSEGTLLDPVVHIGKEGITPECTKNIEEALEARELIKVNVQRNCMTPIKELANTASERTKSEIIQVIGRKFVLYKESKNKK